jgi:hypothetical protein
MISQTRQTEPSRLQQGADSMVSFIRDTDMDRRLPWITANIRILFTCLFATIMVAWRSGHRKIAKNESFWRKLSH